MSFSCCLGSRCEWIGRRTVRLPVDHSCTDKSRHGEQRYETRYTPALRKIAFDAPIFHVISVACTEQCIVAAASLKRALSVDRHPLEQAQQLVVDLPAAIPRVPHTNA